MFKYGTVYTIQKKRHATQGQAVTSSWKGYIFVHAARRSGRRHTLFYVGDFPTFAASTYNPGDLVDCRHKRGVLSTRVVAVGPHGLGCCSIILSISICLIHVWKYCCTRGFARYADRWTSCALGCNGNSASAMVHLTSSNGDSANTDRYFVHKTSSCEHCPAENVVFLKL